MEWKGSVQYAFFSSSMRYITYLKEPSGGEPLSAGSLCYAEIDVDALVISNEQCIQASSGETWWYAKMNQEETKIMYVKTVYGQGRAHSYDLATGKVTMLSDDTTWHRYIS